MPADERAITIMAREGAERLFDWLCEQPGFTPSGRDEAALIRDQFASALKEADRLAREDAARIAERHVPSSPSADCERAMRRAGEDIAAAIRASITTDEGMR